MDAIILAGSNKGAAAMRGRALKTIEVIRSNACDKLPGDQPLHKLLAWYEHRRDALRAPQKPGDPR